MTGKLDYLKRILMKRRSRPSLIKYVILNKLRETPVESNMKMKRTGQLKMKINQRVRGTS